MITTSNFARSGKNKNAVAISIGIPRGWYGKRYIELAPPRTMLNASKEEFDSFFYNKLSSMDAEKTYKEIINLFGEDAILLCWESPNIRCHRRIVAEWFETELGIIVPEFGFERFMIKQYAQMLRKGEKESLDVEQLNLFAG